ncbi:MAG: hypothetical protein LBG94_03575 [Treponema sp.]|jgi:tetratricopeptide (TPR) repeat protein|nr:hypothetical protein [Treponema sp.]
MVAFSRRLIYTLSNKVRKSNYNAYNEKLIIDFAKPSSGLPIFRPRNKESLFNIKSESSYNSYLSDKALELGLKKTNCIAWTDIPEPEYTDHIIEAKFKIDSHGGYAAAGIIFRIMDDESYYLALVSSKGYFRFDVVKNNAPKTCIAWTEVSDFDGTNVSLNIITYGTYLIFHVNNKWVAEVNVDLIASGRLGFAAAAYEESGEVNTEQITEKKEEDTFTDNNTQENENRGYVCKAHLEYISIDTRLDAIETYFKKWTDASNINAECHLRLAETYAAMNDCSKALDQLEKAWKRRDEAIISVTTGYSKVRTRRELLLAARMSFRLERYSEAEDYINLILIEWPDSAEGKLAYTEKLKILFELKKYAELKDFALKYPADINKDINYFTMLARSYWELKKYKKSAETWDKAFKMAKSSGENGIYAANAANAWELAEKKEKALEKYILAGKIFLNQDNLPELAAVTQRLALTGEDNWEARALIGKWSFSIEDYAKCSKELDAAEKIRKKLNPQPDADPALYYLRGLVYYFNGNKKSAIRMINKAVKLAPDYELFRTKLEEIKSADKTHESY